MLSMGLKRRPPPDQQGNAGIEGLGRRFKDINTMLRKMNNLHVIVAEYVCYLNDYRPIREQSSKENHQPCFVQNWWHSCFLCPLTSTISLFYLLA